MFSSFSLCRGSLRHRGVVIGRVTEPGVAVAEEVTGVTEEMVLEFSLRSRSPSLRRGFVGRARRRVTKKIWNVEIISQGIPGNWCQTDRVWGSIGAALFIKLVLSTAFPGTLTDRGNVLGFLKMFFFFSFKILF